MDVRNHYLASEEKQVSLQESITSLNRWTSFNELVTVSRNNIINIRPTWGVSVIRDSITANGTNASVTSTTGGEIILSTGTSSSGTCVLQTTERGQYQSGTQGEVGIGFRLGSLPIGSQDVKWGYFDEYNGFGYGYSGANTSLYVFRRKNAVDAVTYQNAFNINKFDGSITASDNLNVLDGGIFEINFTWYGHGDINYVYNKIYGNGTMSARKLLHINSITGELSTIDPNQPITVSATNGYTTTTSFDAYIGGRQYSILNASFTPYERNIYQPSYVSVTAAQNVWQPITAIRKKQTLNGNLNTIKTHFNGVQLTTDQDVEFKIEVVNSTISSPAFFTPTEYSPNETGLEALTGTFTSTTDYIISRGIADATGAGSNSLGQIQTSNKTNLTEDQYILLSVRRLTANATAINTIVQCSEEW